MNDIVKYTFPNSRYNFGYVKPKTFFGQRFVTNKTAQSKKLVFANKIDYNSREVATENNKDIE